MKKNKKLLSTLSIVCAFAIIFGGVFAFFSDSALLNESAKVGKVDIDVEGGLFHSNALNNLNPGDNDPDVPTDYRPGTDHELSFEIDNLGNKSVVYRTVVEVSATKKDGTAFTAEELRAIILSEKQNVTAATTQNTIASNDVGKQNDITRLDSTGYNDGKLIYIVGGTTNDGVTYVLNGTGDDAETETNVTTSSTVQTFDVGLDKDLASDAFEGATITFNVIVQAMQYRNTGDGEWNNIFEQSYTTGGTPETDSDEFQEVQPSPYAIYSADDDSLLFYKNTDIVEVGDFYNGRTATSIYYGFETDIYMDDSWEAMYVTSPWHLDLGYSVITSIKYVEVVDEISPVSTACWFEWFYECETFVLDKLDTSNVIDMNHMFFMCSATESLDVSHFDTSKVEDMSNMFYGCYEVDLLDVTNWEVSTVTNMNCLFREVGMNEDEVEIRGLADWDVSNVTDPSYMFLDAGTIATTFNIGDISGWDTSKATNMAHMFNGAGENADYYLDLSGWDVSNVTYHVAFNAGVEDKVISPWD